MRARTRTAPTSALALASASALGLASSASAATAGRPVTVTAPGTHAGPATGPALASTGGTLPLALAAAGFAALGGLAVVPARRRQRAEEEPAP